jgi:hypothetical protein
MSGHRFQHNLTNSCFHSVSRKHAFAVLLKWHPRGMQIESKYAQGHYRVVIAGTTRLMRANNDVNEPASQWLGCESLILHAYPELSSDRREPSVHCPERQLRECCRGQQMHINPTQPAPHQMPSLNESQHFCMADRRRMWQLGKRDQEYRAPRQVAARQLADDEWMGPHLSLLEELHKHRITAAQMVNPNRSIDEHRRKLTGAA